MAKKSAKSETDTMPRPPTPVFRRPTQKAAARLTDQTSGEDKLGMASGGLPVQPNLLRRSIEPTPLGWVERGRK